MLKNQFRQLNEIWEDMSLLGLKEAQMDKCIQQCRFKCWMQGQLQNLVARIFHIVRALYEIEFESLTIPVTVSNPSGSLVMM